MSVYDSKREYNREHYHILIFWRETSLDTKTHDFSSKSAFLLQICHVFCSHAISMTKLCCLSKSCICFIQQIPQLTWKIHTDYFVLQRRRWVVQKAIPLEWTRTHTDFSMDFHVLKLWRPLTSAWLTIISTTASAKTISVLTRSAKNGGYRQRGSTTNLSCSDRQNSNQ